MSGRVLSLQAAEDESRFHVIVHGTTKTGCSRRCPVPESTNVEEVSFLLSLLILITVTSVFQAFRSIFHKLAGKSFENCSEKWMIKTIGIVRFWSKREIKVLFMEYKVTKNCQLDLWFCAACRFSCLFLYFCYVCWCSKRPIATLISEFQKAIHQSVAVESHSSKILSLLFWSGFHFTNSVSVDQTKWWLIPNHLLGRQ